MTDYKLKDFIPSRSDKIRRIYEHMTNEMTATLTPNVLEVNLELLNAALKGDCIWAANESERRDGTFVPGKYIHYRALIQNGEKIKTPWLSFDKGRTRITDGRHRLYVLMDEGYTHCSIVVDDDSLSAILTLVSD